MPDTQRPMFRDLGLTYEEAAHGVQTAIKYEIDNANPARKDSRDRDSWGPKHLRVGVDLRAADAAGLARLLIDKGLFTEEEYVEYLRLAVNEELYLRQEKAGISFR